MTILHIIAFLTGGLCGFIVCGIFAGSAIIDIERRFEADLWKLKRKLEGKDGKR